MCQRPLADQLAAAGRVLVVARLPGGGGRVRLGRREVAVLVERVERLVDGLGLGLLLAREVLRVDRKPAHQLARAGGVALPVALERPVGPLR
jgi:hypothetical protein